MQTGQGQPTQDVRMFEDALYPSLRAVDKPPSAANDFGKMFDLPSFAEGQDPEDVVARLRELGKKGGLMDGHDPRVTITNPLDSNLALNPDNPNPEMTVGFTFLGQFLDHDITFDPAPLTAPPRTARTCGPRSWTWTASTVVGRTRTGSCTTGRPSSTDPCRPSS